MPHSFMSTSSFSDHPSPTTTTFTLDYDLPKTVGGPTTSPDHHDSQQRTADQVRRGPQSANGQVYEQDEDHPGPGRQVPTGNAGSTVTRVAGCDSRDIGTTRCFL